MAAHLSAVSEYYFPYILVDILGQFFIVCLVKYILPFCNFIAVDRQAAFLVFGKNVVKEHRELLIVGIFGCDEGQHHFFEVFDCRLDFFAIGRELQHST